MISVSVQECAETCPSVCVCVSASVQISLHYECEIYYSFGCVPTGEGHDLVLLDAADVAELRGSVYVGEEERDKLTLQVQPLCAHMETVWMYMPI